MLDRVMTALTVSETPRSGQRREALGVRQDAHLTALTGALLVVLLAAEGVTVVGFDGLVGPHLVIGTLLLAPVALKIGSTGWKILRYYRHSDDYVAAGPPPALRRVLAPVVIITTVGLLGTGVALLLIGPSQAGRLPTLHRWFFAVWCAAIALHLLVHARRSARAVVAETGSRPDEMLPGRPWRAAILTGTLVVGVLLATWSATHVAPWTTAIRH